MKLVLIPCAATEWTESGRLLGRVEVPMTEAGRRECVAWVELLRPLGVAKIFHSPDELATQTAKLLAKGLKVSHKPVEALAEVDLGLWTGLTEEQLEARYESAYNQLREEPMTVTPPEGESLSEACERIGLALNRRVRRGEPTVAGVVLRPVALALARCILENKDWSETWAATHVRRPLAPGEPIEPAEARDGGNGWNKHE